MTDRSRPRRPARPSGSRPDWCCARSAMSASRCPACRSTTAADRAQRGRTRARPGHARADPRSVRGRLDQARPLRRDRHQQEVRAGDDSCCSRTSPPGCYPSRPTRLRRCSQQLRANGTNVDRLLRLGGDRRARARARRATRTPAREARQPRRAAQARRDRVSSRPSQAAGISRRLVVLLAFATGAAVANMYYAQPLLHTLGARVRRRHGDHRTAGHDQPDRLRARAGVPGAARRPGGTPQPDLVDAALRSRSAQAAAAAAPTSRCSRPRCCSSASPRFVAQVIVPMSSHARRRARAREGRRHGHERPADRDPARRGRSAA